MAFIMIIFLVVGIFLLVLGIMIRQRMYGKHSVAIDAICIEVEENDVKTNDGIMYGAKRPLYRYEYNGKQYTSSPSLQSDRTEYQPKLGKCRIRINPNHPERVYSTERRFVSDILIGIGTAYIMITIIIVIMFQFFA